MKTWLFVVGSFYVVLGLRFTPFINAKQTLRMLPTWTAPRESVEFKALVDWQWVFGTDLLAIGLVAIVSAAAGSAEGWRYVVWVIAARELIGGVIPDVWLIIRGYTFRLFYAGFIALHLAIIASGLALIH